MWWPVVSVPKGRMLNHQSIDSYSCQGCDIMKNAFECALCSFLCDSETVFRTHLNAEHKSNFLPCVYCETLYNASHFLLRHLKATHSLDAKVYRCGSVECTFKTIVLRKFLSHLDLCTVGKSVKCYHCKSTFSSSNLLILHMQGKLKILLNKAYPIDKIIRIVPSPAPQPVFHTYSSIRESESSVSGNLGKTRKTNDVLPVNAIGDQSTPHSPVPVVSLSSKRLSYILPKSVVVKPVEKAFQTYSVVTTPRIASQEFSLTRKVSHNEKSPYIFQGAVVLPNPPDTGNSNKLISGDSLPKNSILNVSSSGKLSSISMCQISSAGDLAVKRTNVSEAINKTTIITTNVSLSASKLENELPKRDTSGYARKGTGLLTLPVIRVDPSKTISVKNTIPSNTNHRVVLPKSPGMMCNANPPVSAGLNSLKLPSWQKNAFNKNMSNVAHPKHCFKIPSKIMIIPMPPPTSVYTVLQPEFSRSDTCSDVTVLRNTPIAESTLSSARQNSIRLIQSPCRGSINQAGSQSSLSFPLSSALSKLHTASKTNFSGRLNMLLEPSSKVISLSSSEHVLNSPSVELEAPQCKNSFKTGSPSLGIEENCASKVTFSSTVSATCCAPETSLCDSCTVTSNPFVLSSVACNFKRTDSTAGLSHTSSLAPSIGTGTAVSELGTEFSSKSKVAEEAKHSSLKKTVSNENILPLKCSGLINKLCTCSSYSEKNCDRCNFFPGGIAEVASNSSLHYQRKGSDSLAAKQNSVTTISEICLSSVGSQTPLVSPVTADIKEELTSLSSCISTNKICPISTSSTFVTYVKQEVISSCDIQFARAAPGLSVKSEVTSHEKICDRFSDYYGDIAAVVSSHSLLSQRDSSNGVVSASPDHLISAAQQSFHLTAVSQNSAYSVDTPVLSPALAAIKEASPSPPLSCTDISKTSSISSSSTFATSVKQEVIPVCDLQCKTPPLSPIVAPNDSLFGSSFCGKSEISSHGSDFERVSTVCETLPFPNERNPGTEVIRPLGLISEVYSSHNITFISSPSCVSNLCKEINTASVSLNANGPDFTFTSTMPVSTQYAKLVTACTTSSLSDISQISSDADFSFAIYTDTNGFKSVTSSLLTQPAGSAVLVNKNAVCDVTFTTLAIKPKISSNSSHSRTALLDVMNTKHTNENSICGLPLGAPVHRHSETLKRNEVCGISPAQHSAKIFSKFVPLKLTIATSDVACTAGKSSYGVQCGGGTSTAGSSGINEKISNANCISQISSTFSTSICDSQHTSLKHSTYSTVTPSCETISKGQSICAASDDHQSSHTSISTMENNIPYSNLCGVAGTDLAAAPEPTEKSIVKCGGRESMMSFNAYDECKSTPCDTNSSSSLEDRHPFLNSTNMTVRQILEKFRGKCKSNVNISRKRSLRTTSQTHKKVKNIKKQHAQCSNPLSPASTITAQSANKTILKPSVLKEVSQPPVETGLKTTEDISIASCKRKADQVLEMDITVEDPTLKVRKFDEQVMSLHDNIDKHPFAHFTGECGIKHEILPSYLNEESISGDKLIFDQYCFSQLGNEALSNSHSSEDVCSATDILQVARELLSYNETPEEMGSEVTDILQALKQRKSEKALKEMLQPLKLKDFFKCMVRHCSYTSNFCVMFSKHLKEHNASLCTCAYCLVDFPARDNLICHMMQEHKKSLFQCSLCFYRAYSQTHVCVHFRKFHSCEKGHIIACSPLDNHPVSTFKENYMLCYTDIARLYNCCFCDCSFSCIAILDVIHHILYHHPVCSSYVCTECKKQHSDIFEWLIHCQQHGIHLFHCVHCAFGAETRTDMLYHISMYHANESLIVFVRSSRYLMLHLEFFLKYNKKANLKNLFDISNDSPFLIKDQIETEVQVILENSFSMDKTLKCLYCLCCTKYASEMQNHLYSKHSENDIFHYFFCQSQFQTISEAKFIFGNLSSSDEKNTLCTDMILLDKNSLTINQPTVPLQIIFVETPNGVVNMQLPLAVCKQNKFRGKYVRIFKSLYNQIQSKIHRKRFKCLYCQKTERHLYKLRQHWRYCHVQTGKKFKYELIKKNKYEVTKSSCETWPSVCCNTDSKQDFNCNSRLHVQNCSTCQFSIYSHKTGGKKKSNWDSLGAQDQLHQSQCDSSLKIMDSFSIHEKSDNSGYWRHHSFCCSSCNFLQSTKVPFEDERFFHKCNCMCKVHSHTISKMFKQCSAEITGKQICTYSVKNKVQQLRNQCTGMFKRYRLVAPCYCLMKCSRKDRCFKKQKSSETDKCTTEMNDVKLRVFLRKLPYSVKLPVLYLKQIISLDPVVVLSDIKYLHKMK